MKTYFKKLALTSSKTSRTMTKWHRQARLKAWFLLILMLVDILAPFQKAYALTSGPIQPEFQSFTPVGTTDMVNTFTGDFNYNIPLFELPGPNGGYPFNLAYTPSSNIDGESGPVGWGWSLNPGVITRSMRGLPDDFKGDDIKTVTSMKDNVTAGVSAGSSSGSFEFFGFPLSFGVNAGLSYNSYKGFGFSIGGGPKLKMGCVTANLGIGIGSQSGLDLTPSISFTDVQKDGEEKDNINTYGVGLGFNSRSGMSKLSLSVDVSQATYETFTMEMCKQDGTSESVSIRGDKLISQGSAGNSSGISFAQPSYTPSVSLPWQGFNVNFSLKLGASAMGAFVSCTLGGYYVHQFLSDKGKEVSNKAYGYLNSEKVGGDDEDKGKMMDFNREKDGSLSPESPYMALATGTADIYSVSSQGGGGMFRPYRAEHGAYHDAPVTSITGGGNLGGDAPLFKFGWNVGLNMTYDQSDRWNISSGGEFGHHTATDSSYEPVFFKSVGESTTEPTSEVNNYGGDEAIRLDFDGHTLKNNYLGKEASPSMSLTNTVHDKRKPRNTALLPLKNNQIISRSTTQSPLAELNVSYYSSIDNDFRKLQGTSASSLPVLDRKTRETNNNTVSNIGHHIGAFTSYDPSGLRYVYALPAYNTTQISHSFSLENPQSEDSYCASSPVNVPFDNGAIIYKHGGTDNFYKKEVLPPYAHSYMLTSVLGADYVDSDGINGPSNGDLGYWVKFTYRKSEDNYKWRTPYYGAAYQKGYNAKKSDDKGNFVYGEKEVWDLARVETKTHVAVFHFSERHDGHGAYSEFNNEKDDIGTDKLYKVDRIDIFTRNVLEDTNITNPVPMKSIHFEYTYDLCGNVWNNDGNPEGSPNINARKGKLTLKKVYFTYEGTSKGKSTPYVFDYNEHDPSNSNQNNYISNPDYAFGRFDRWGNYKSPSANDTNGCDLAELPYVRQFQPGLSKADFKAKMDKEAAVWHLHKVTLPSGAGIKIDWEAKTYGHVQNKVATQMFAVAGGVGADGVPSGDLDFPTPGYVGHDVYFQLEEPIDYNLPDAEIDAKLAQYLNGLHKTSEGSDNNVTEVYFKIKSDVAHGSHEYVSGYTNIKKINNKDDITLVAPVGGSNLSKWARIGLESLPNNPIDAHPFKEAAWQFLRTDLPELAYATGNSIDENESPSAAHAREQISSLLSVGNDLLAMFGGYFDYCNSRDFGRYIDTDYSFIRLCSPDREKYGDGARVKQITLVDAWNPNSWGNTAIDEPNTYGQVYEYQDGVATFEPAFGGDETALRYPKKYTNRVNYARGSNNLFVEYPLNESAYPSPMVGYAKVIVKSLATALDERHGTERTPRLPEGIATTGKSLYEYYTAKDFPVITYETDVAKDYNRIWIPIPPFVNYEDNHLFGSYGVSTILNDMHGKPKAVAQFAQNSAGEYPEELAQNAVSWVQYNYKTKDTGEDKELELASEVPCISSLSERETVNGQLQLKREMRTLGVDYEINNDTRKNLSIATGAEVQFNFDHTFVVFGFLPIPSFLPSINYSRARVNTATTNKIIRKTGILESIEAYDNGAVVKTENLLYDAQTGTVVLSRVDNSYKSITNGDTYVYDYNIPAHLAYEGMGAAYKNIGLTFDSYWCNSNTFGKFNIPAGFFGSSTTTDDDLLFSGDELLMTAINGTSSSGMAINPIYRIVYTGETSGYSCTGLIPTLIPQATTEVEGGTIPASGNYKFTIVRSGRRNILSGSVGNVKALSDPTKDHQTQTIDCKINTYPLAVYSNTHSTATYGVVTKPIPPVYWINNVLSASASTYSQYWVASNLSALETPYNSNPLTTPYLTGQKGRWKTEHTYNYVNDRSQTVGTPKLSEDGVMNKVPLFDYNDPMMPYYGTELSFNSNPYEGCLTNIAKWIKTSTAISYSIENMLESMDALGLYAANIYGYGGALMLASAANARQREIAFESFEESFSTLPTNPTSNLNLAPATDVQFSTDFNVLFGNYQPGTNHAALVIEHAYNGDYFTANNGFDLNTLQALTFIGANGVDGQIRVKIVNIGRVEFMRRTYTIMECAPTHLTGNYFPDYFSGKLTVFRTRKNVGCTSGTPTLSTTTAHTGRRSLKIGSATAFNIASLDLVPNKTYNLSFWIKENTGNKPTLNGTITLGTQTIVTSSTKPVDGWIRVDCAFTAPSPISANEQVVTLRFNPSSSQTQTLWYVDDIRIMPFDAGMTCSVYDPVNYRLRAALDNNHYATFYQYDAEGNLSSIKRETEKGIVTVQYGQGNIKH